jgi:signal transduction histidine kinase
MMTEALARSWNRLDSAIAAAMRHPLARRLSRNSRLTIPVCILLICGSFAAAALLQMQLDRSRALTAASRHGTERAASLAAVTAMSLDRFASIGQSFADNPAAPAALPGLRNIAVFGPGGESRAILHPLAAMAPAPPGTERRVFAFGPQVGLAFSQGERRIVVLFDKGALAPPELLAQAALLPASGPALLPLSDTGDLEWARAAVPGWPLTAAFATSKANVLADWIKTLPLYLFVILGPAIAGAGLAALLVGAFERHARASRAIRALRSTRPVEGRLMVRLANAERGAAEALRSKSEFIAHMSHELRTPLNAVIGFSEIIAGGYYGPAGHPKYAEYARDIGDAGRNLHGKIGDILEFANIEAGRFPLKEESIDLAALAGACLDEQQGRAFSRRIRLGLGAAEAGLVRADALAVKRVLTNLLVNALTYTASGGFVRADVRFEDGAGVLTLTDSGKGFSPAEQGKAGKPFERFDRAGIVTGAGLGLAIAMELTRRMGGAMRLAGQPGSGAVMEIRLPRL